MKLPPGFVLEEEQPRGVNLPPGFVLEEQAPIKSGIAALPVEPKGGFIPAIQRSALQTGSLVFDILPAMAARAVGADEYAERQFKEAAETEKKIQEKYAPAVASYKDIKDIGSALTYAAETVGELIPSILPSLFTGGAAGVIGRGAIIAAKEAAENAARKQIAEKGVGAIAEKEAMDEIRKAGLNAAILTATKYQGPAAFVGSGIQTVPEAFQSIKETTGEESLGAALAAGSFNALLDAAFPLSLLIKIRKAGVPSEAVVGEWYKRFGKAFPKGFALEGATEVAQEMSTAAAEKFVDENQEFFSEKNLERFINAGLKGGIGGGVVSGTTDVVLGKRSLSEDLKPLDEDIRNTQSDILARRALLDELRAQADEEGKNKLDADALKDLGFGPKYSLYDTLLNKDINDPAQAEQVVNTLEAAINAPDTKGRERVVATNTLEVINQYLSTRGEPDVGQVVEEPSGAGVSVPPSAVTPSPAEGLGAVERTGVVPPVEDVGAPVGGEGVLPTPVEPAPVAAAPVETATVPTITAPATPPVIEPAQVEPAPVAAAPIETAAVPPGTERPVEAPPTTRELIAQQETELAAQMDKFQNLLQQQVQRFGLKDVAVKVVDDLVNANGQYSKGLIKLAVDAADPVRDLRHESVHALKELGFFTPNQWDAMVRRANDSWINTYLRNRNIDGGFIEPGQTSRYDAYVDMFKQQGLNEAQIQESLVEEAISDAFGDFNQTKAPPGMMQAILNRMKNFFRSIKEAVGFAEVDPERLFGKIERAELAAPAKPQSEVAAPPEKRTAPPEAVPETPKASIAAPRQEPVSTAPENQAISNVAKKLPLSKQMFDSTSLGMQTGKAGKEQFEKQKIGGIPEIVSYLERRRRASGLRVLDIGNEVDRIVLSDLMAAEALASIDAGGAALEWYDETIAKTIGMAALKYPDLATDPDQQMVFKLATAIASQGMNVEDNLKFAMRQYEYFRRNNRFEEIGTGTDAKAMQSNYMLANEMFNKYGLEKTRKFLATPFKVEELRSAGFEIGGELGEETVLGSSIFGPKIGFGFYSNLNGNFEPVTMDMWFMRLIGRLTGKLRLLDERLLGEQLTRFRETFNEVGDDGVYANDFTDEELNKARSNDEAAIDLARIVNSVFNSEFSKANLRELYDEGVRKKTAFVNAAQRILNSVDNPKDAPQNGTERQQLRDVTNRTVKKIEQILGRRIPPASLQALVWYPEQELYASLGAKLRVTSQDYAGAMKGLLEGEGYGRADLDQAAENGARRVRGVAVEPVPQGDVPVGREPRAAFGERERETFLEEKRTERVIEQEREKPRRHKVVFEVAPDPTEAGLVDEWRKLDADKRLDISNRVAKEILPRVLELLGADGRTASQVGSYQDDTNPSFALYLDKGNPVELSKYLGYILGQDSMMVISPRPAPGLDMVGAVVVDINSQDPAVVDRVYQQLRKITVNGERPVGGQSTINGKMVVLNYSNLSTDELARTIQSELKGAYDVAVTDVYSAFPEKDSYDYSDPQADPRGKAGALRSAARALRREATQRLAQEIGFKPTEAREEKPVTGVKYSISGKRITDTPELREAAKQSAIVDADGNLIPMYHGTAALIRIFRGKQAGATFLSPDPEFAAGFTSASRDWMVRHIGQFLKPDEIRKAVQELRQAVYAEYGKQSKATSKIMDEIYEVLREAKETGVYKFKGELEDMWTPIAFSKIPGAKERVMELYVLAKNPFDFESKDSVNKVIKQMLTDPEVKRQYGYAPAPAGVDLQKPENFMLRQTLERTDKEFKAAVEEKFKDNLSRGSWRAIETPEVQRALRALKFDSFYVIEGGTKNLGVYDPKLIKSADENVGPFGQRPPTEEEAKAADMILEDAIKAQEEGDIRFSLRAPQTPEFKRWFGDSKVVDANGEPLVVYHGTGFDFDVFEGAKRGTEKAYFFAKNPELASDFAMTSAGAYDGSANVMPVYLRVERPLVIDYKGSVKWGNDYLMKQMLSQVWDGKYDGVIAKNVIDGSGEPTTIYAVINPNKIKSATGNIGTFDLTSPDIRKSLRSSIDPAINARILQTTTAREEKTFPQRITQALGPESYSRFRAAALNRYNSLGVADKKKAQMMGGIELLADSNAESAALNSDLAAGIVAGALGVYDKVGGVPVYNRHFVVERIIQGPRGPQFVQVGGKITSRQAAEALARRFPDATVRERGYTNVTNLNNTIKGPLAIFAPLAKLNNPDAYRAYQYWAGVKRGSKWMTNNNGQVVEQLFEKADIPKAEKLRQEYLAQGVDFNQIQKEWTAYNDQLVKYMLDTGVISKENAKKFTEHGDYLPFYRQINGDDDAVGPRIFQPISAVKQPRKIKGGEDPLGDFLENMVRNTQAAVQAGLKNVAARRAADVGMDVGTVRQISQAQASPINSFYVLENGQKVFYDTDDLLFIDSIKSLGLSEFPGIGLLSGPASILRNLVTKDPGFMLANMMRDSLAAWTTSGVNMLPIAATLKNFAEAVAGSSPEYKTLLMAGVVGGYDYSQGTQDAAKQFGKELRRTAGTKTVGEKALTPFTSLWEGLEKGTQASDAATRIEVYKQTLKETGNEAEALFRALEVMNFNRRGNNPIVRVLTAAVPFLNARMQGLDVLYRAGFGKNATSNAKAIQRAFWTRGMYMAALSTMYWMLTHDDEEYERQEQETKDNNWLFPSAGIKIPIPFEVGVLFKVIPERISALTFGDDTARDFTQSMLRNLLNTLAFNPIPQTFVPLVETVTNFNFFTMRPIVGQGLEGVAPAYQVSPGTSRIAENLGKNLNISPMKIDQIIQGYTGTIGTYMSQLIDSIYDMHTDNPKASLRFEQMPVIKRFILDPDARGQVTAYFDLKNSVDEATRTANLLERSMNFDEWGKYYTENVGLFAVKDYILDMDKTLKEFRDMKNMIRVTPMSADDKRDSILAITQMENQLNANIQLLKKNVGK